MFALAVVGVTAAIYVCGVLITPHVLSSFHYSDFGTFYRATATNRLYGPDPDLPVVGSARMTNLNSPFFHFLFRPLTLLPLADAYVVWLALTAGVFVAGLLKTAKRTPPAWPWWMWCVLLAWTPLFSLVYTGQITALVFVPLTLAWWADRDRHRVAAGFWLGLAFSLKPHLLLVFVWWVFRGRWRSLVVALLTTTATVALAAVVYGWSAYASWAGHLGGANWTWAAMNSSLWALPSRLWQATPYYAHLSIHPQLIGPVTAFIVVPAGLATFWGLWKVRNPDIAWALALISTTLIMPLGWAYYAWWWVPMAMGLSLPRWVWSAVALLMVTPVVLLAPWVSESILMTFTVGAAPVYASAILWAAVLRLALTVSQATNTEEDGAILVVDRPQTDLS